MALITGLANLIVVGFLLLLALAFGLRLLEWLQFASDSLLEDSLFAAGLSFALLEIALFVLGMMGWLRSGSIFALLLVMALIAGRSWVRLARLSKEIPSEFRKLAEARSSFIVGLAILLCLTFDAVLGMAPLSGSDAMHYHFTVPLLTVGSAFRPIYWLTHSFLIGQNHLLISLGFALGSEQISLGMIFLGGVLSGAALFVLSRQLMPPRWALLSVLTFCLTPMVYWQMSTSGSPDIWMAFYTTLAILAASRGFRESGGRWLALAGFFAGTAAGAKYTGWVIPLAIAAWCLVETRSWKWSFACGLWSIPAGIWPLLRNAWWTHDAFFPFLTRWLAPENFNAFAFQALLFDTRAPAFHFSPGALLLYPFSLALRGSEHGVGHYFGPVIISFAPLLLLVPWKNSLVRIAAAVWLVMFVSNALTSQMARFLLPVYPLSLALVFAGVSVATAKNWRIIRFACPAILYLFLLFGAISEILYARDFLPAVVGTEPREAFLGRMAADYETVAFINHNLEGIDGRVMVFLRHLYYLRVPYVDGDPRNSWLIDPARYAQPTALLNLLHQLNVRWVVKSPDYPDPLRRAFQDLETERKLRPVAEANLETLASWRVYGQRRTIRVVILKVAEGSP